MSESRARKVIDRLVLETSSKRVEQFKLEDHVRVALVHKGREVTVEGVIDGVGPSVGLSVVIEDDRGTDITGLAIYGS